MQEPGFGGILRRLKPALWTVLKKRIRVSQWWSGIGQAKLDKLVNCRRAGAHYFVGPAPVKFQSPIVFRDSAAGKDNVVHIADDFPLILGLQNPAVTNTENFCRVVVLATISPVVEAMAIQLARQDAFNPVALWLVRQYSASIFLNQPPSKADN